VSAKGAVHWKLAELRQGVYDLSRKRTVSDVVLAQASATLDAIEQAKRRLGAQLVHELLAEVYLAQSVTHLLSRDYAAAIDTADKTIAELQRAWSEQARRLLGLARYNKGLVIFFIANQLPASTDQKRYEEALELFAQAADTDLGRSRDHLRWRFAAYSFAAQIAMELGLTITARKAAKRAHIIASQAKVTQGIRHDVVRRLLAGDPIYPTIITLEDVYDFSNVVVDTASGT
jgi:tetratricopeptide (TPR) repeat protein